MAKQRVVRMEQKSQLAAMQQMESRSDAELESETKYRAAAQAILGARAAQKLDPVKTRAHFQRAIAAAPPQERLPLRRMAETAMAQAERRAGDYKRAKERIGQPASGREVFMLRLLGLVAPPKSAGGLARTGGILIGIAIVIAILLVCFGIVNLVALPVRWPLARPRDLLRVRAAARRDRRPRRRRTAQTAARAGRAGREAGRRPVALTRRRGGAQSMCGRYTLTAPDPSAIRDRFPIGEAVAVRRRFNVAPGDEVLAVTIDRAGEPRGELLRWGLVPTWSKSADTGLKLINARVETASERPAFRRAFERFRCLIVADGFYEWRAGAAASGGRKQPFHITRDDGGLFAFAGLWSIWHGEADEVLRSCTILTTAANPAIAALHDRMPVILDPAGEHEWLDTSTPPARLAEILAGLPASRTVLTEVGFAVNDARYDGPECLAAPPPPSQAALF